jgi:hypothetical protein
MAITANNTTLTFNDASTQTTSAVTAVNVSTGISSTGGKTPTLTNTGVTSVTAGTGISLSGATGGVTITSTATGTVTSVATGNGLSGGTITTTGTLLLACPGFNTVGSYCFAYFRSNTTTVTAGTNYAAGSGVLQMQSTGIGGNITNSSISGTWKWMGASMSFNNCINPYGDYVAIACRVS